MISTHILDTSIGSPAAGVKVKLQRLAGSAWTEVSSGETNADGRFAFQCDPVAGAYQIVFEIESYFARLGKESFFCDTPVIFRVQNTARKYHVPLLLNPFGFSTYRGS